MRHRRKLPCSHMVCRCQLTERVRNITLAGSEGQTIVQLRTETLAHCPPRFVTRAGGIPQPRGLADILALVAKLGHPGVRGTMCLYRIATHHGTLVELEWDSSNVGGVPLPGISFVSPVYV